MEACRRAEGQTNGSNVICALLVGLLLVGLLLGLTVRPSGRTTAPRPRPEFITEKMN